MKQAAANDLQIPPTFHGPCTTALRDALAGDGDEQKLLRVLRGEGFGEEEAAAAETEDVTRLREIACYHLAARYVEQNAADKFRQLFLEIRPLVPLVTRARTARITRKLIDRLMELPHQQDLQEQLCTETVQWCLDGKRTFLRLRVEARLAQTLLAGGKVTRCLALCQRLLREVKQIDDKLLQVEISLTEAQAHFASRSLAKAKAALTGARSAAHAVHCPPLLQAQVDMLAGTLLLEDGDAKTAFSYFYEPFEAFAAAGETRRASAALKYLLLAKILDNQPKDALVMVKQAAYVSYAGRDLDAMVAISRSVQRRDLALFERALRDYAPELGSDPVVQRHTQRVYQSLLESNLIKVLEPYSQVEVEHIASLIALPAQTVAAKLCEMILDRKLRACIHQEQGILQLFNEERECAAYADGEAIFTNLMKVSTLLHRKIDATL